MELEIYFEASYKQTNIRKKKRSYRYIYTQDAESTVVKAFSFESKISNVLFPAWLQGINHIKSWKTRVVITQ